MNAPDARGWVAIGLFVLFLFELTLRTIDPTLRTDVVFNDMFKMTWQGGLVVVVAFYFVASKGSADKDATIATMAAKTPDASK